MKINKIKYTFEVVLTNTTDKNISSIIPVLYKIINSYLTNFNGSLLIYTKFIDSDGVSNKLNFPFNCKLNSTLQDYETHLLYNVLTKNNNLYLDSKPVQIHLNGYGFDEKEVTSIIN